MRNPLLSGTVTVDISSQPKGMYFVKISNGVNSIMKKIVVQ
ncbi:MAG: T9SS type A sorting domain-containing protein [Bacteroidetes bacterium]|nr:T9SS type A sorting domain-containing protein [Bacteroidota bacterium]